MNVHDIVIKELESGERVELIPIQFMDMLVYTSGSNVDSEDYSSVGSVVPGISEKSTDDEVLTSLSKTARKMMVFGGDDAC